MVISDNNLLNSVKAYNFLSISMASHHFKSDLYLDQEILRVLFKLVLHQQNSNTYHPLVSSVHF